MLSRHCLPIVLAILTVVAVLPVGAQEIEFPHCALSDSMLSVASGLDDILHPFGDDTETYPNEFDLPSTFLAFSQVFDLYVSDGVSNRWSQSEWQNVIAAIMNNDTTDTDDDIFGVIWGYFTREDADSNDFHAGVRFKVYLGDTTYTKIVIKMYDRANVPYPCPSSGYGLVL